MRRARSRCWARRALGGARSLPATRARAPGGRRRAPDDPAFDRSSLAARGRRCGRTTPGTLRRCGVAAARRRPGAPSPRSRRRRAGAWPLSVEIASPGPLHRRRGRQPRSAARSRTRATCASSCSRPSAKPGDCGTFVFAGGTLVRAEPRARTAHRPAARIGVSTPCTPRQPVARQRLGHERRARQGHDRRRRRARPACASTEVDTYVRRRRSPTARTSTLANSGGAPRDRRDLPRRRLLPAGVRHRLRLPRRRATTRSVAR